MNDVYELMQKAPNIPFRFQIQRLTDVHKHWHAEVEIILVLRGTVTVTQPERASTLGRDDILLINRSQIHELHSADGCDVLSFQLDLGKFGLPQEELHELYFDCDSSRVPSRTRYTNLKALIALIVQRNSTPDDGMVYDNKSFAYSMLKELTQHFPAAKPLAAQSQEKYLERMNAIVRYVDSHYRENMSLVQLAEAVHLSPPYLSSMFTKYLGVTFSEYYNSVRLSYATRDLLNTEDPIDLVATRNGYANAQAFVRAFKSVYNILPSAYRRQHSGQSLFGMGRDNRTAFADGDGRPNENIIDLSGLMRYLPRDRTALASPAQEDVIQTTASAQWSHISGAWSQTYRGLVGIGSAKQILLRETQRQLEEIQAQIGFEFIKFHGLFSDEMMVVSRDNSGALHFNFRLVDMVFDYLFSIRLKPVLQLSFMPLALAQDPEKRIFDGRYNTSQPAKLEEWCLLVKTFFEHLFSRYGRDTVAALPVLVWNNADSSTEMFGMQEDMAFFRLYRDTFRLIKDMDERIRIGSPPMTFMQDESIRWAERFFLWEREQDIIPDFFCSQYYSEVGGHPDTLKINLTNQWVDHLEINRDSEGSFPLHAGLPLSTDPDRLKRHCQFLAEFKQKVGISAVPTWITEWNLTVSHRRWISDTMLAGCYVVKNVLESIAGLAAMGYWSATDLIEEQPLEDSIFHGGLGLMTIEGIRKPQFLAYETLRQLRPHILAQGEGYIVTRDDESIAILMYNYEHFNDIYAGNKIYNMTETDRYTPFTQRKPREFNIHLSGLGRREILETTEFITNRANGCAFDKWVEMGAPSGGVNPALDRYRLELLKVSARPMLHDISLEIHGGSLDYSATLEPLEFRLALIQLKK